MPVLLDLFCKAGGCAAGYHRAGFSVVGIDIEPQPNYPYEFHQADALEFLAAHGVEFDAIHASPPCQTYSKGAGQKGTWRDHPDLIWAVRSLIVATGRPGVIENIEQARGQLLFPVMLCGSMFGLGVFRHRLFEPVAFGMAQPMHVRHRGKIGDGKYQTVTGHSGGKSRRDGTVFGRVEDWKKAMGIDWMNGDELAQAIPPAYTEYIGQRLMQAISK